ncbi:hypothetical protein [Planktotalea sp.]|uniref:hypothetical protein n=1 Tax=Planktotalea sp. TaxID=2029877 RepID=UPI003D6AA1C1
MLKFLLKSGGFIAIALTVSACNSGGGGSAMSLVDTPETSVGTVYSDASSTSGFSELGPGSVEFRYPTRIGDEPPKVLKMVTGEMDSYLGKASFKARSYSNGDLRTSANLHAQLFVTPFGTRTDNIAQVPTSGSASLSGRVEVISGEWTKADSEGISQYKLARHRDDITLKADFKEGTLVGKSSILTVDGTFSGKTLKGTVSHDSIEGELHGRIGTVKRSTSAHHEAAGVFHGKDAVQGKGYSGAFVVKSDNLP